MSLDKENFNSTDVYNPILGSAIEVPRMFWKPGTAASYNQHIGKTSVTGLWQGVLMAGMNPDSPFSYLGSPGNINLHWPSITTYFGQHTVIGRSTVLGIEFRTSVAANTITSPGPTTITGSFVTVAAKTATISGMNVNIVAPPATIFIGGRNWLLDTKKWDAKKNFDIPHPTKKDHRLRHVCVEGPTADVYIRGKLTDSNVINLPDYWKDLVDEDSITVQLQPIGSRHFHLNVEKLDNKEIHIKEADDKPFECFYHVYGERKDCERNIPEYEGLTPDDYPGDNNECNINI